MKLPGRDIALSCNFKGFNLHIFLMEERYQRLTDFVEQELAGCDPLFDSPGNFEVLMDRLGMMIALYRSMAEARVIVDQVTREAKKVPVKFHEYILNELQYEMRLAKCRDVEDELEENRLLLIYSNRLEQRFPRDVVEKFIKMIRKRRGIRKRA